MRLQYLELGRIVGTHGVRGELRVDPWCDTPDYFENFTTVYLGADGTEPATLVRSRPHKNLVLVTLEGVDTMEKAEALRGRILTVDRDAAPLEEGTAFVAELLGCTVKDADDPTKVYGTIRDVFNRGATDVWSIVKDGREYLMPAVDEMIVQTDVDAEEILVRPIPGIFDDAEAIR